ncbi:uncharacterized protein LY79DRAFT_532744 [Colletotrichum navitas]|uniref:Uncharacterized protein n=1 Tax=Colletotrichum navitas TaxID=681940 RepID=A0AAD8QDU8_9PEZI|nr:uncharacterized protein LY79DRAFT_532744 [Colletotrichum navitas]KAK1600161.1 hypothetical protein LY79DRAFT_532744 [Colletotrichum navitas]
MRALPERSITGNGLLPNNQCTSVCCRTSLGSLGGKGPVQRHGSEFEQRVKLLRVKFTSSFYFCIIIYSVNSYFPKPPSRVSSNAGRSRELHLDACQITHCLLCASPIRDKSWEKPPPDPVIGSVLRSQSGLALCPLIARTLPAPTIEVDDEGSPVAGNALLCVCASLTRLSIHTRQQQRQGTGRPSSNSSPAPDLAAQTHDGYRPSPSGVPRAWVRWSPLSGLSTLPSYLTEYCSICLYIQVRRTSTGSDSRFPPLTLRANLL